MALRKFKLEKLASHGVGGNNVNIMGSLHIPIDSTKEYSVKEAYFSSTFPYILVSHSPFYFTISPQINEHIRHSKLFDLGTLEFKKKISIYLNHLYINSSKSVIG